MSGSFERHTLAAGADLFTEGETGTSAFVIEEGAIEIWVRRGGRRVAIAKRTVGDIVGEMAMFDDAPRSATATALEDCVLFEITAEQFRRRTEAMDPVMRTCLGVMLDRFRTTLHLIETSKRANAASLDDKARERKSAAIPLDTLRLERDMARAIEADEFVLFQQPIIALGRDGIAGFEALVRWQHPDRGFVPPGEFIPLAEASGMIGPLTRWVAARAARDLDTLSASAGNHIFLSLNVSAFNLAEPDFAQGMHAIAAEAGAAPERLKLEVTESALLGDPDQAIATLQACRDTGFSLAVDDFGTGYSSLSYLTRLPVGTLKIDRSFVSGLDSDPAKEKIVKTILMLARELELDVVAEGIETRGEAARLTEMGCGMGQGYLYARPMPLDEAARWCASLEKSSTGQSATA